MKNGPTLRVVIIADGYELRVDSLMSCDFVAEFLNIIPIHFTINTINHIIITFGDFRAKACSPSKNRS